MAGGLENEIGASALGSMALHAATLKRLALMGVISRSDIVEIFEDTLLNIEESQARSPHLQEMLVLARQIVEQYRAPLQDPKR